ncbi:MAG TPA: hypothetical protein VMW49_04570, partial [Candidatus Dormibacteraeota bacterium]|nr:hypothetical protein [Candidatus Dormibacteraeota bacterium]
LRDALAQSREAARVSAATGDRYLQAVAHWETADILAALGEPEQALGERDQELCILTALDNPRNLAGNQLHRAQLLARLGRDGEAARAACAARDAAIRVGDPRLAARVEEGLAKVERARSAAPR